MPEIREHRTHAGVAEKVDASSRRYRCRNALDDHGYSLFAGGFKTNAGGFFVTLRISRSATTPWKRRKPECAAVLTRLYTKSGLDEAIVIPVRHRPFLAWSTGGFEFWIQDTGEAIRRGTRRGDPGVSRKGAALPG